MLFNFTWKDTSDNRFLSITRQEYHTKDIIEKEGDYVEVVQSNVIENLKADLFTSKLNKETIFIASTWLRPVGKEELKNKFENFKFLKTTILHISIPCISVIMRIKTNYKRRNSMNCLKNLMKRQKKPRGIWYKRWAFLPPFSISYYLYRCVRRFRESH